MRDEAVLGMPPSSSTPAALLPAPIETSVLRRVVLIDGLPGTGKSSVLHYAARRYPRDVVRIFPKVRTGGRMPSPLEYASVSDADFSALATRPGFFEFGFAHDRFGFFLQDLEIAVASAANTVLIVRSSHAIRRLMSEVKSADIVPVLVTASPDVVEKRVLADCRDSAVARRRLARSEAFCADFDPAIYKVTVSNNGFPEEFQRAVDLLFSAPKFLAA